MEQNKDLVRSMIAVLELIGLLRLKDDFAHIRVRFAAYARNNVTEVT